MQLQQQKGKRNVAKNFILILIFHMFLRLFFCFQFLNLSYIQYFHFEMIISTQMSYKTDILLFYNSISQAQTDLIDLVLDLMVLTLDIWAIDI